MRKPMPTSQIPQLNHGRQPRENTPGARCPTTSWEELHRQTTGWKDLWGATTQTPAQISSNSQIWLISRLEKRLKNSAATGATKGHETTKPRRGREAEANTVNAQQMIKQAVDKHLQTFLPFPMSHAPGCGKGGTRYVAGRYCYATHQHLGFVEAHSGLIV